MFSRKEEIVCKEQPEKNETYPWLIDEQDILKLATVAPERQR